MTVTGDPGTAGTVEIPGMGFEQEYTIGADSVALVTLPTDSQMTTPAGAGGAQSKAVHVTADRLVTVYGMNRKSTSTDGYLGLPVTAVGTRYRIADYGSLGGGFLLIVPVESGTTTAHIEPPAALNIAPFDVTIAQGDVYQYEAGAGISLTGAVVTTDKPASVYGGNRCANVPSYVYACDHLVEQLQPTASWGNTFVTYPLATRTKGDTFRVVADVDGTTVSIAANGAMETVSLAAGEYHEWIGAAPQTVTGDKPIQVMQYSNGSQFDGVVSDPFMAIVPSVEQGFTSSTIAPPSSGFENYVNLTARTLDTAGVLFDGAPVEASLWQVIPGSNYSAAVIALGSADAVHTLTSSGPVMTLVYGWADYDSYGYPGGFRVAKIATATALKLDPSPVVGPVGSELCTVATLTDGSGTGIAGARIDVVSDGVAQGSSSVVTDASGTAQICLTDDEGDSSVAGLTVNGTFQWQPPGAIIVPPTPGGNQPGVTSPDQTAPSGDGMAIAVENDTDRLASTGSDAQPALIFGGVAVLALLAGSVALVLGRTRRAQS
ncbi:hemagglutinin/hemolysin-like protein [Leifsonia xyli subsp. cynodontis DSM 46306]|uniref:IgGFc-binding protein N-terminal domain-containing protein n=1 Tax=Leifsonia xyli subsp. cynodontis DSM 46306 TaxID=1389489 RepID=U3P512_LEIXC|nr:hemagglutinin/hemolysin-like protein [Leifsonia xyli subsp. cynodontis DSM 46306]